MFKEISRDNPTEQLRTIVIEVIPDGTRHLVPHAKIAGLVVLLVAGSYHWIIPTAIFSLLAIKSFGSAWKSERPLTGWAMLIPAFLGFAIATSLQNKRATSVFFFRLALVTVTAWIIVTIYEVSYNRRERRRLQAMNGLLSR